MSELLFGYDQELIERFPTTRGGVISSRDLDNRASPPQLLEEFQEEQQRTLTRIGDTPLSQLPSLAAWRRVFTGFGVKPTQYRSAAESLLRRLTKQGDIPSINALVDTANLVSIRYGVPVAVFDQAAVTGSTVVRTARGNEQFTDLGGEGITNPDPGEVIFVDSADLVSARRWCWRQSRQSAAGPETTVVIITVEGHHDEAAADVSAATADICDLLDRFQPNATKDHTQLSPDNPGFSVTADS